ncbi:hypothetical protein GWK47_040838 [Chionoecetes opilio]|uniref:Uncharacterized protein n=1 Tax=Chionoecetes opilio TaxID=41210 RepID=A0A8J4YAD6_CHIOP|nr:hypothetical protein GWK47_040838 [Chionoecetes opilio]
MVWEPTKCCCCCNVRTGSIVIAILFLVGGSFSVIGSIKTLIVGDGEGIHELCKDEDDPTMCVDEYQKIVLGTTISSMVISIFHIIFASLLLHGILKKKTLFFVPLMIAYVIQISLVILISVIMLILLMYFQVAFGVILFVAAMLGMYIFLETYFLLVIRAHYFEIKRAKGHIHTALKDRDVEVPPHAGPAPVGFQSLPPPYPSNEVPPYPIKDAPLYPGLEKTAN